MIESVSNKKIKHLVQLREKSKARNQEKLFVAEGIKMFAEAPLEGLREIYVSVSLWKQLENPRNAPVWERLLACREKGIYVEQVSEEVLRKASDTQTPQGILFVMEQCSYSLKEITDRALERWKKGGRPPLFLLLEDIQDPGNLGTMLRTSEGAGADAVIMSRGTADIYNPKTIRATMGSLYRVPFLYVEELAEAIAFLKEHKITVYAAHLQGRQYFDEIAYEGGSAFLIGNEGNGLRLETARQADIWLKIPMEGKLESLNAAVSAALLLYAWRRGRRHAKFDAGSLRE
ncbi:MAG: RNA methyltransferase [Clostridium sp.]|nr:RNA methyltransferase [Clostridium sp.]